MRIRDYQPEDFSAVEIIHNATQIDYKLPDFSSPLFLVTKVVVDDQDRVRAFGGLYLQVEAYLILDRSNWASPEDKLAAVQALDGVTMHEAWLRGIECCVLWLPPGMERFGRRLVEDLGFVQDRPDWISFSKRLGA